jgi:enoyl-CoA hydratase
VNSQFIIKNLSWLQSVYNRWEDFPVPVIAAIHGICYGSGTELILACDIRIAASNARIAIPEVRFGLSPDMGGTTRLPRLVGPGQAKRLILACEEVDAQEARAIGLVDVVVEPGQLMERAIKMANRIAGMPPVAVRMAKKGINLAVESSRMAGLYFEQAQSTYCCGTEDQKEAIKAFFEKRKPVFNGR